MYVCYGSSLNFFDFFLVIIHSSLVAIMSSFIIILKK